MVRKLLIVFALSFAVIFAFRAYGDHTTGGFPTYGYANFLYWNILYSLIPVAPAFLLLQIALPPAKKTAIPATPVFAAPRGNKGRRIVSRLLITAIALIAGIGGGTYLGILFASLAGSGGELDALAPVGAGAFMGATVAIFGCWYFFTKK